MKKIFNIFFNLLPFAIWIGCFYLEYMDICEVEMDLFWLFLLPIGYSIYNYIFSDNGKLFLIQNIVFAISQVTGFGINGLIYHNCIFGDSESALFVQFIIIMSVIYITLITLFLYGMKLPVPKKKSI